MSTHSTHLLVPQLVHIGIADCGAECSQDGIHSRDSVYNVLVQILFNILKYCTR